MKYIREKLQDWADYDPKEALKRKDEYRARHDMDCILLNGDLNADTIISLWSPLRAVMLAVYGKSKLGDIDPHLIGKKYEIAAWLLLEDHLEQILNPELEIVQKLDRLFELGMKRENVMRLPAREINSKRGLAPYWDYMPYFLYECFDQGDFASYWESEADFKAWAEQECLQPMFEDEIIERDRILDMSGSGDVRRKKSENSVSAVIETIKKDIVFLERRRELFDLRQVQK